MASDTQSMPENLETVISARFGNRSAIFLMNNSPMMSHGYSGLLNDSG